MLVEERERTRDPAGDARLRNRAVRGGGVLIACKWLAQVLSWGVTLGVARILAPSDYGVLAAASILLGLGDLFAEAGVGRALVQKREITAADVARAFTLSLMLSVGCYVALLAASPAAARFLRTPELRWVLPIMGGVVLLVPFKTVSLGILDRKLELKAQGLIHVVSTALQAATVLALALLGAAYWALVTGALIARLFDCVALALLAGWRPTLTRSLRGAGGLLRYGIWISGGSVLWYFYSNSDYAVVGRLEGPTALGYYSLAFQLMSMPVQKVTANINQVAFPVFCRLQGDPPKVKRWYLRLTVLMTTIVLPLLIGAAVVADDGILVLFGPRWLPAVAPFRILCVVGLLSVVSASLLSLLNALGRPDVNFKYTAVCACVFPLAFAVAGQSHGMLGVCAAWVVVQVVSVSLLVTATRGITTLGPRELLAAQRPVVTAGLVMTAAVLGARAALGDDVPAAVRLLAAVAAGALAFTGGLWLLARETVVADLRTLWREVRG